MTSILNMLLPNEKMASSAILRFLGKFKQNTRGLNEACLVEVSAGVGLLRAFKLGVPM